jgi:lipopolysaccharide assembly protein A
MRAVYWTVILAVAAVLSLFAASNRETVSLGLWPLPFLVGVPLYLVVFAAVIAGFLLGALVVWIGGARRRGELRRCRRRNEALARELDATQSRLAGSTPAAAVGSPAIR